MAFAARDLVNRDVVGAEPGSLVESLALRHLLAQAELAKPIGPPGENFGEVVGLRFALLLDTVLLELRAGMVAVPYILGVIKTLIRSISQRLIVNLEPITARIVRRLVVGRALSLVVGLGIRVGTSSFKGTRFVAWMALSEWLASPKRVCRSVELMLALLH